jgi:site-specific recombinase XerD
MHVILYKRHKQTCDHKDEPTYKRCDCAVWFQTNIDGKQKRWTSKESSWEAAQRTARVLEQQYEDAALGRTPQPGAAKSVREAVALFLEAKAGEGLSPDTIYRHKYITALLLDFCNREGVLFIKDLNLTHLTAWQAQWTVKAPQARRSRQEKVKNFLKYCFESEMISKNPALKWKGVKIKLGDQNVRAFTEAEYEKILSGIDATTMTEANKRRIRVLMQLQRWSGLSLVDAVCLSKDELKQEGKGKKESFRVVTDRQKTGTLINNWIPAWLGQELLTVKNGNPEFFFWSGSTTPEDAPSYFQKLYRKVFKAAGVEGSSHDFRHTYAVELLKSGVDIRTVSKALGHSSVTITEKFYSRWCTGQQDNLDNTLRAALEG